jgi:uncharacterized protein (TIRG00374 family)
MNALSINHSKRFIGTVVRVLISVTLLGLLFYHSNTQNIAKLFISMDFSLLIPCYLLVLLIHLIASYRWFIFVKVDYPQVPVSKLFSFYLVALFFNNFLPTAVGGDVVRTVDLYKYIGQGKTAVVSVFMERFAGMTAQIFVAFIAILIGYRYFREPTVLWLVCGISISYLLFLLGLFNRRIVSVFINLLSVWRLPRVPDLLSGMYKLFLRYRADRFAVLKALILSVVIVLVSIITFYLLSLALRLSVPFTYFVIFLPIMTIVSMVPISLGGLGVREGIGVFLFSRAGLSASDAFGLSLSWSAILILVSLLGGMIFALRGVKGMKLPSKDEILTMRR